MLDDSHVSFSFSSSASTSSSSSSAAAASSSSPPASDQSASSSSIFIIATFQMCPSASLVPRRVRTLVKGTLVAETLSSHDGCDVVSLSSLVEVCYFPVILSLPACYK